MNHENPMSKSTKQNEKQSEIKSSGNAPDYEAFQISTAEGADKQRWTKIGVGFHHRDGNGMNLLLDKLPENGRVTVRTIRKEKSNT